MSDDFEEKIREWYDQHGDAALFLRYDYIWELHIGNPSGHVRLGEVGGIYETSGATIAECVDAMEELLAGVARGR